jgi:hypothetical protein
LAAPPLMDCSSRVSHNTQLSYSRLLRPPPPPCDEPPPPVRRSGCWRGVPSRARDLDASRFSITSLYSSGSIFIFGNTNTASTPTAETHAPRHLSAQCCSSPFGGQKPLKTLQDSSCTLCICVYCDSQTAMLLVIRTTLKTVAISAM